MKCKDQKGKGKAAQRYEQISKGTAANRLAKEQQRSALTGEAKELHSKDQHCDGMAKKYKVTNSKGMAWRLNAR